MNLRKGNFCLANPTRYRNPMRLWNSPDITFEHVWQRLPTGWTCTRQGVWVVLQSRTWRLPEDGWKVHASAQPDNAQRVLKTVSDYCFPRGITFKFLPTGDLLLATSARQPLQDGGGRFLTIYPVDCGELEHVLVDLSAELVLNADFTPQAPGRPR